MPWRLSALDDRPWRPLVAPLRIWSIPKSRTRRPLLGQLCLPGMEMEQGAITESSTTAVGDMVETGQAICPNCGWTEFNEEGDCTRCWEPDVVPPVGPDGVRRLPLSGKGARRGPVNTHRKGAP